MGDSRMIGLRAKPTAADLFAIHQALGAYPAGIDSCDYELFRSGFTADVRITFAERIPAMEGIEQLVAFMEALHRGLDGSAHRVTNQLFTEFDHETATVVSYVHALLVCADHPEGSSYDVYATYTDWLRLTGAGWRVCSKHGEQLFVAGNPAVLEYEAARRAAFEPSV
jgi:SnoaL-like domain